MQSSARTEPETHRRADEFAELIAAGERPPSRSVEDVVASMAKRLRDERAAT